MTLQIEDSEIEDLVARLSRLSGESEIDTLRRALTVLAERLETRTGSPESEDPFLRYLREEFWPRVPEEKLGKPLTKEEEADILGYGPEGVG